ncbi:MULTISPECIES: cysteine desulfurase family protein [Thermomonospora]|uniref:Aminotransferase class V n=1 Tax=Thermomonospora curvata (strain ATCC 19995 / DSM 43183 / JCM 3096 / KCTC 9072 / NBRC 15933 / NCIMB 10081 / Henssen B9) TaxID=471852 RepID=D1ABT1_THECD|nr:MULTISPECIES: cysteine desulfurase family protein [Thermomonospora]ACY99104.1 aminotransferase class V [Thermomonospora curvata DSM 43183]PKK13402.1 MAG: cysteine desulfurase [Thermomonospora sp. CIF 1]
MTYLDHAATTPMLPEAVEAMTAELGRLGNPSSLHSAGRRARRVVEESREIIADVFDARPSEVIFTGGGTEADNLAVKGIYWARRAADPARTRVLVGAVEHHAVLDAAQWLADHQGARVEHIPVDSLGRVDPDVVREMIGPSGGADIALITVMWANNEVGTVQPVAELAALAREHDIPFHTDAVQAAAQLPVSFAGSGVHSLALSGHKLGGPLGVGVLLLAKGIDPVPVLHGGGQERDVRSGTLDTPAIAGLAAAVQAAAAQREEHARRLTALRDRLIACVLDAVPDAVLNGDPVNRLPGNAHLSFPGCEGDALLMLLDARGIACSTGSACSAGVAQPSHVLLAMGASPERARGSLRFSLGHTSTEDDVTALAEAIGPVVERARRAGLS